MNTRIEAALNGQIEVEAQSSHFYFAMAVWAEVNGFGGVSEFMYTHADEERQHMLKLVKFVNERGGRATIPALSMPPASFGSIREVFETLLSHEQKVTNEISHLVHVCLEEKDYTTHNFLQWYVSEQLEEEALARLIMDKLKMVGDDKTGLYIFDRDLNSIRASSNTVNNQA